MLEVWETLVSNFSYATPFACAYMSVCDSMQRLHRQAIGLQSGRRACGRGWTWRALSKPTAVRKSGNQQRRDNDMVIRHRLPPPQGSWPVCSQTALAFRQIPYSSRASSDLLKHSQTTSTHQSDCEHWSLSHCLIIDKLHLSASPLVYFDLTWLLSAVEKRLSPTMHLDANGSSILMFSKCV